MITEEAIRDKLNQLGAYFPHTSDHVLRAAAIKELEEEQAQRQPQQEERDKLAHTLSERGARYGDFTYHALIADNLIGVMQSTPRWAMLIPAHRQALRVHADKIARILNGDPNYKDNWHDIQGYAKLAEDRCTDGTT